MTAAQTARPIATGRLPTFTPMGSVLAIVISGIVAFVAGQIWVMTIPPVRAGSTSAVLGEAVPCSGVEGASDCYLVPFSEGREVGVGFTVRNDAPVGMTILAVEAVREGVSTPAALEAQLTREEPIFGLGAGVPFEPVEVAAGAEQAIQFVGTYGDCETVAQDYMPGSGLSVSQAFVTVQWGIFSTQVEMPLPTALALGAPASCP